MSYKSFSTAHARFRRMFVDLSFDSALAKLKALEELVETPEQQKAHDCLVDAVYNWFEDEEESEDYVIIG